MLVEEVASLFRKYTDESDTTFLTDEDVALYLYLGYSDFRQFIENIDKYVYKKSATYTGVSGQELDLANVVAPAAGPASPRLRSAHAYRARRRAPYARRGPRGRASRHASCAVAAWARVRFPRRRRRGSARL